MGYGDDFDENPNPDSKRDDEGPEKEKVRKELSDGFPRVTGIEIVDSHPAEKDPEKNECDAAFGIRN